MTDGRQAQGQGSWLPSGSTDDRHTHFRFFFEALCVAPGPQSNSVKPQGLVSFFFFLSDHVMSTFYMPDIILHQRWVTISYQRPDSRYFRFCELYGLSCYYTTLLLKKKKIAMVNMQTGEW